MIGGFLGLIGALVGRALFGDLGGWIGAAVGVSYIVVYHVGWSHGFDRCAAIDDAPARALR